MPKWGLFHPSISYNDLKIAQARLNHTIILCHYKRWLILYRILKSSRLGMQSSKL
jgi:hypothetical protein